MSEEYIDGGFCFSKSAHGDMYLTDNFKVKEFACQDGTDAVTIHFLLPHICQGVRNYFNYPFTPNSAYRTPDHNKAVGGAARSLHLYGRAVDIPARGNVTPKMLYDFLDKLSGDSNEIGLYGWGVHIGICSEKKRFTDSSYRG